MTVLPLRQRSAWLALETHERAFDATNLRGLFANDPTRGERFRVEAEGLHLDYSKQRITEETIRLLVDLANESDLAERRDRMFRGEHINVSEDRAVLHVALRMPRAAQLVVDGVDVVAEVHAVLDQMTSFATRVRSGQWKGHTGKVIRNVVNLSLIHISEPTRQAEISYAVFCLKKKK